MNPVSRWLQAAWYRGHPALVVLAPLEALYAAVVNRRRQAFLNGASEVYRPPVPVIVVGNLTVGGTGKTPLILWLIEHCRARGWRVGVVSRGYGASPPSVPWRVEPGQEATVSGDEPLLIVRRTGVPLVIDADRACAVRALLETGPLDLILSDDGLQHYRLARDLELVLIDAARGLGNRRLLPRGPLREPAQRLEQVDAVLLNGADDDSPAGYGFRLQPVSLVEVCSGRQLPLDHLPAGQAVHAVAGIGNPQRFFATLEALHWRPIEHPFADHASFRPEQLAFSPDLPVVMTEKDAVKCRAFALPGWLYLKVEVQPSARFVEWFDSRVMQLLSNNP